MKNLPLRSISIAFLLALIFATLCVLFVPKSGLFVPNGILGVLGVALCGVLVYFMGFYRSTRLRSALTTLRKHRTLLLIAVFTTILAIHVVVALSIQSQLPGWDPKVIYDHAVSLVQSETHINDGYFLVNQNNIGMLSIMVVLFKGMSLLQLNDYLTGALILNVVLMEAAAVFVFLSTKRLFGNRIGLISILFSFVLITLSLWTQTPYTDTFTLLFPILIFYLFIILVDNKKHTKKALLLILLLSTISAIGYFIKPTVIIVPVAILIVLFLYALAHFKKSVVSWSSIWRGALVVSVAVSLFFITNTVLLSTVNSLKIVNLDITKSSEHQRPVAHFIMMGLKTSYRDYGRPLYGAYTPEDDLLTTRSASPAENKAVAINEIKSRLRAMGAHGYLGYLAKKSVWILSDGTFYAYGEGLDARGLAYTRDDAVSWGIQRLFNSNSRLYPILANTLHAFWIVTLLLVCIQIIVVFKRKEEFLYAYILRLSLLGIILFVLIFEGRSRYLYNYIPLFIVSAMYSVSIMKKYYDSHRLGKRLK